MANAFKRKDIQLAGFGKWHLGASFPNIGGKKAGRLFGNLKQKIKWCQILHLGYTH